MGFEIVYYSVFILDVTLEFFDLMLETADFVIIDIFQFLDFSLSGALRTFDLGFNECVVFGLFRLPSSQAFFCFSSQVSFSSL